MTEDDLCFAPAHVAAPLMARRALSPVEYVRTVLGRVAAKDGAINAMTVVDTEGAMAAARAAEQAIMDGAPLGPLHGVPVTIKDLAPVAGLPMKRGSHIHANDAPSPEDAPIVTRLKAAGAIVIGKTTTSEFGWSGISRSPLTGITHNPWKRGYNAGASSAGAGAAGAAGYGPLHQGSDGAGSIRMPSHFCGLFGLKPTFGRVPYAPPGNNDGMSHIGPMTRTVMDSALMMQAMAGPHPWDQTTLDAQPADYPSLLGWPAAAGALRGKRIAYSPDLGHARVDPEVAALVKQAAADLTALGATVEEVTPPWGKDGPELGRALWSAHMSVHIPRLPDWADRMDQGLVACVKEAIGLTASQYMELRARKALYAIAVHKWFQEWDFLLTPAVSTPAFPAELLQPPHWDQHEWDWLSWAEFSYPFNISQNPAASIPCGFTADGLPVGLQLVGKRLDDLGVLQAAAVYEAAHPWADKRPSI